jgi:hypothetical protein
MPPSTSRPATRRQAPNLDRGMSELAWLGSRLTTADLQAITAADARGGLEGVRRLLADSGLTDAGFYALEAQYGRGGIQAVGTAVQAQIQHETQAAAEQDAVGALEKLQPAQWAEAARILATGGPQRLAEAAIRLGMSPAAAGAAARHLATHGVEQTRQAVTEGVRARARADAAHAAAEKDLAAVQGEAAWNPLATVDVAQAALNFYAAHGAALERAGVGAKDDESPTAWLRRVARADAATVAKVAAAVGEAPEALRPIFDATRTAEDHREIRAQLIASDETMRKAKAIPVPKEQAWTPPQKKRDGLDAALRKAVETTGFRDPNEGKPIRAEGVMDAAVAMAAGRDFKLTTAGRKHAATAVERRKAPTTGIDAAMGRAVRHLESGGTPDDARAAAEGTSTEVESTDTMNGGSTDAE